MNLLTIVLCYGYLDDNEQKFLLNVASQWGVEPCKLDEILLNPAKVKFNPPKTKKRKH